MAEHSRMAWEGQSKSVRITYAKCKAGKLYPEYCGAREIPWEYGGPPSKPKYYLVTDREEYCEGKVKRTPGGE